MTNEILRLKWKIFYARPNSKKMLIIFSIASKGYIKHFLIYVRNCPGSSMNVMYLHNSSYQCESY